MSAIDLSADIGLVAVGLATANLLLGLLMALRYSPVRHWPHRRFNYFALHNWTGYLALGAAILHPVVLLFSHTAGFHLRDVLYPVHSPSQPLENTIGAIGFYLIAIVVVTSYFRHALGRRTWKAFHYGIYLAAAALFWHSIFTDPLLKNSPVDPFDGEKVFIETCLVAVAAISVIRWRRGARKAGGKARVSS
ncbi:MAG TPA: ferric reductase-like transmembrane domain-containing protein [Candidatus Acidoferrales bacterium]|nr:ferric reductase-like transmembrane domain-containing protein [Candidatus Acidoferrales bacterium]